MTYNSMQNHKSQNNRKGNNDSKNRQSLTELKKRNHEIEGKLKVMD